MSPPEEVGGARRHEGPLAVEGISAVSKPDTTPADAPWDERFFHLTDPGGHELSFARPLPGAARPEVRGEG
jgi:hypothetical protein